MPVYEFESKDGERIERELTREQFIDLPMEGDVVVLREGGKTYKRAKPSVGGPVPHLDYDHDQYPKISNSLQQWCAGADHVQDKSSRHYGKPIIRSRRHQDELCRQHGYTRDYGVSDY